MKRIVVIYLPMAVLLLGFVCGCDNSDGTVSLDRSQTADLAKLLGTYEGPAQPRRIMGAMMTGVWTVAFAQDDSSILKCKCTLRLHDSENGWGSPETTTVGVQCYRGAGNGEYNLKADGRFGEGAPWSIPVNGLSLTSSHVIDAISLFDMDSYEIKLQRK